MIDIDFYIRQVSEDKNVSQPSTSPCYHFGDVVLVKYSGTTTPRPMAEEVAECISKKKAKGIRIPAYLAIKREHNGEDSKCWVLQEAAKGKLKLEEYPATVLQAPDSHYEQMIHDLCELKDMGIELKDKNIFYDPDPKNGGFTFIDFLRAERNPFQNNFADVSRVFQLAQWTAKGRHFSESENHEAIRRVFTAMEKVIPNFSKYRRGLLRTLDKEVLDHFTRNNTPVGDLTLTPEEATQYKMTEHKMLRSCLEGIRSGGFEYWQIRANEIPNRSKSEGLSTSWEYHPLNPLRPDDFDNEYGYSWACKDMLDACIQSDFVQMLSETNDVDSPRLAQAKIDASQPPNNPAYQEQKDLYRIFMSFSEHSSRGFEILKEKPDLMNKSLDETGISPILMALRTNNEEAITYLLQKGVNLTSKDKRNRTVLDYLSDVTSEQIRKNVSALYTSQMHQLESQRTGGR